MKSRSSQLLLLVAALLLAPVLAHAAAPAPALASSGAGFLTALQNQFTSATSLWMTKSLAIGKNIFVGLAGLDIAWTGVNWLLKKNDLSDFIAAFTLKMLSLLFFYMLMTEAPTWLPTIIDSLKSAGSQVGAAAPVSAGATLDPSTVFGQGMSVSAAMWNAMKAAESVWHPVDSVAFILGTVAASIMVLAAYALIAVQILITNVEVAIVLGGGAILLGFNGSKWTQFFPEKYIGYIFNVGIKLFVLYLVTGLGQTLADGWISTLAGYATNPESFTLQGPVTIGVAGLMYGAMGVMVPGIAGTMLSGSPSMSLGNTMGAAAGVAGGLAGAGKAAVGATAAAAGAAQGGLAKLAALTGAGAGGPPGGVGGMDKLASLGAKTGAGSGSAGGIGGSKAGAGPMGGIGSASGKGGMGSASGGAPASGALSKGVSDAGRIGSAGTGVNKSAGTSPTASPGAGAPAGPASLSPRLNQNGQSTPPAGTDPTAAATGGADALGAPTAAGASDPGKSADDKKNNGKSPWDLMKAGLGQVGDAKDAISRHEGGGSGIQIRLNHSELP